MTWWNDYVGIPYKLTGRTREDGLDCWGLVRLIHQEQFGIELPSFSEEDHSAENVREVMASQRENWVHTDDPKIGDVILLRVLGSASHVGLYLGDKQFIHAKEGINSAIERIDSMAWEKRIIGFYRYAPDHASFIGLPNPLKTVLIEKSIPEGTTISQLIKGIRDENNISDEIIGNQIIFVNSKLIPVDQWDNYIIQGGERVEYRALPTKDIGTLLTILVLIAAPFLAPYVALGVGISVGLAQTGIMIAGSLLINALFPVRPPELGNGTDQPKSQLLLQGGANAQNPFGSIPVILGQFRYTPPLAAENYSDIKGTSSYLRMLVCWGYGPLAVSDLRLGDTSLDAYNEVDYETIGDYSGDSGDEKKRFNRIYGKDISQDIVNAELISDGVGAKTYAVVSNVCTITYTAQPFTAGNSVILDFTSGNGIDGTYTVASASTNSFTVAMVVGNTTGNVEISSVSSPVYTGSPWSTQVVSGQSEQLTIAIHFPEGLRRVALEGGNAGDFSSASFRGQIQFRQLDPDTNAPITNWGNVNETSVSTILSLSESWFNINNDLALEKVYRWTRITLDEDSKIKRYDGAYTTSQYADPTGNLLTRLQQNIYGFNKTFTRLPTIGDGEEELWQVCVYGNDIVATVDMRSGNITGAGITTSGLKVTIAAATITRAYSETIRLGSVDESYYKRKDAFTLVKTYDVAIGKYEVRVRRTNDSAAEGEFSGSGNKYRNFHKGILYSVTGVLNTKPVVAPKGVSLCMTAVRIKATDQLNGNIEGLVGTVQSVCPDYDSATSTWITRPTRNPASLFRYVLQHPANAQKVADSKINLDDLITWHTYCKSNSFMFDMVVTDKRSLLDVMRDIAAAGRASPTFRDGKWSVIIDKARTTVVQFFTPHNSWGFESVKALPRLPHAFRVSFNNAKKSYQPDEMIVYNDGYTSANATLFESMALPGVTTTDQIFKHARFHYAQLILRPERYSLNVDMEHLICTRGDLVRVRHDVPQWGLGSGRIKTRTSGTVLILDEAVPMDASVQYTIRIRAADGTSVTRTVAAAGSDGFYNTITLTTSVTATEGAANNLFMFGSLSEESVQLIVQSIEPSSELTARLTLVDYSPAVYNSDDETIPAFDSQITKPPYLQQSVITAQPIIVSQKSDESVLVVLSPGKYEYRLSTTFANPSNITKSIKYVHGQVDYAGDKIVNFSQDTIVPLNQKYIIFGDMEQGESYTVRLRYETEDGKFGPWTIASDHTITGKTAPPKQILNLTASVEGRKIRLTWSDSLEPDFSYYEVRTNNNSWGDGNRLWRGKVSTLLVDAPAASASSTWYVKAADDSGNYSTTGTSVTYTSPAVTNPTTLTSVFADRSLTNATITLNWNDVVPTFGLDYYEVSYNSTTKTVKASTITLPADWIGSRVFTVKTVDLNANISSGITSSISKLAPSSVSNFRGQVIDNSVMLYWTLPSTTSLPIDHVLLKKGTNWATATEIGRKDGGFTTVNETNAGTYVYWIAAVDADNNESTPVSVTTTVSDPPDFIFNGLQTSTFTGTLSSALLEQGLVVLPVNLTETWATHFTSRSWASPSDQVTAGYPIFIQPSNSTGYYEEVFDFSRIYSSSKITMNYSGTTVAGSPTIVPKISVSSDGSTYTDYDGSSQIYAASFRYVKARITVNDSAGTGIYQLTNLAVQLDNKLISDAGSVSAVSTDASGTIVNFNKTFIDVQSIQVTPSGTAATSAVYSFTDSILSGTYAVVTNVCTVTYTAHGLITGQTVSLQNVSGNLITGVYTITGYTANTFTVAMTVSNTSGNVSLYPESFRVYLFNSSGTRVSGTASWQVRGY